MAVLKIKKDKIMEEIKSQQKVQMIDKKNKKEEKNI